MAIQYSGGTYRNDLYVGMTVTNTIIANINTTLVAAGWTSTAVKAYVILTVTGAPSNADTITVQGQVYTFKSVINNVTPNEVLIGTAADSISNLKAAINLGSGGGTNYSTATTLNVFMEGGALTTTTLYIQEKTGGGNSGYSVTESMSNATLNSTTVKYGGYICVTALTPALLSAGFYFYNYAGAGNRVGVSGINREGTIAGWGPTGTLQFLFGDPSDDVRVIASKYWCSVLIDGTVANTSDCFWAIGVPWIPDFLQGAVISSASNANPVVVTTTTAHGYTTGQNVTIRGVIGNTAANVTGNTITVTDTVTFSLDGITGNSAYVSGGVVARDGKQIAECIWACGTGDNNAFIRGALTANTNTFWTLLNGSSNPHTGGGGTGTLKFCGLVASGFGDEVLQWYDTTLYMGEPLLLFGSSSGATGYLLGQMYDAVMIRGSVTKDSPGTFTTHNWWNLSDISPTGSGSQFPGNILVVVP